MSWPLPSWVGESEWPRDSPSSADSSPTAPDQSLSRRQPTFYSSSSSTSGSPTLLSVMSELAIEDSTASSIEPSITEVGLPPSTPKAESPSSTPPRAPKKFNRPFSQYVYREPVRHSGYSQPDSVATGITVHSSAEEAFQPMLQAENAEPGFDGVRPYGQELHERHESPSKSDTHRSRGRQIERISQLSLGHQIRSKSEDRSWRNSQLQDQDQASAMLRHRDVMYAHPNLGSSTSIPQKSSLDNLHRKRSSSLPSRFRHTRPFRRAHGLPCDRDEARSALMVMWLYQEQIQNHFAYEKGDGEGVVLKIFRDRFICCPASLKDEHDGIFDAAQKMNVRCVMTVNTIVTRALMGILKDQEINSMPVEGGLQVQVLKSIKDLPGCQLHHFAAFIEEKQILVVWDDDPKAIFGRAKTLEQKAMALVWKSDKRHSAESVSRDQESQSHKAKAISDDSTIATGIGDLEAIFPPHERPVKLTSSCIVSISLTLCFSTIGIGWRMIVRDITVDGDWKRMSLIAMASVTLFFSLFLFYSLVSNVFLMFGSSETVKSNSKYYSGLRPKNSVLAWEGRHLPHVTIQMPVYREGLSTVIKPTVMSLKAAISTYEMQGGTANIFINDDGMQLLSDSRAQKRRDFYDEHNIGWVARPKHNPLSSKSPRNIFDQFKKTRKDEDQPFEAQRNWSRPEIGHFIRSGKFKKASNMNHALHISNCVNEKLACVDRSQGEWSWTCEDAAYDKCLAEVLAEDLHGTWAEGNIRMGDYILVVDSDTRVPVDCLLDGVTEMDQSPEVAILQFTSGVMQLTDSYFENGIAWFANLIYSAITFAVASGDCCPFVGHNALLRWSAIQDAAVYQDEADGHEKYWSESHVSEDFDMSMRLQMAGWTLRYVAYTGTSPAKAEPDPAAESFAEGLSLTVYDELARWEKYAYGCSELLFNPLWQWPTKGPFTRRFVSFIISSNIQLPAKITVVGYMGTYYAVAVACVIALFNFLFMGWFPGLYRSFYLDAFAIYISLLFVFPCMGNVALAAHRHRLGQKGILEALWENFKWVPMFTIFIGGISIHTLQAIASHLLGIEMTWGSTAKEVEEVGFVDEMARVLRRFRWSFLLTLAGVALILACRFLLPREWQITEFFAIFPLSMVLFCHVALPILLNPALMTFSW